ncbi:M14 family metallopeptidase [Hydrogenophaga pseudoflava]|uniref:M14 family metallopeptidase n=1 Tax=Hydrogenophaga pseudoflava TaxID=47421 RepID=UPI0027E45283|nr:M14 family metallocarboxypeptidase [Hydrogenophaga pseudoflava]MDQ7743233.1 M14 family metallocarboxypeptidase [Hydrogenophaga pseudoflava]
MTFSAPPAPFYPIGVPGQPWGTQEIDHWRSRQRRQRSHGDDVVAAVDRLSDRFDIQTYGEVSGGDGPLRLLAVRSRGWRSDLPVVLVTGGVHGYETSGVHGALQFLAQEAGAFSDRVNLLVVPCVSPWAYEHVQRWNHGAVDPNRSFREPSPAPESAALMRLVAPLKGRVVAHIDLHETTDSDESEFRRAKAARDGEAFEPCTIPDGFYLVDDTENPQPTFQQAILDEVAKVTHIAPADAAGGIIGSPLVAPGVIRYPLRELGLCAGITGAPYTTTTEVYPDSPRATPSRCNLAQATAVCAAIRFVLAQP